MRLMENCVLAAIRLTATKLQGTGKREYLETHLYLKALQKACIHCILDDKPGSDGGRFDNLQNLAPLTDLYGYFHYWIKTARRRSVMPDARPLPTHPLCHLSCVLSLPACRWP